MENKWISVDDRLPEIDREIGFNTVLVYCRLWGVYPAVIQFISDTNFTEWRDWNGNLVTPPTHWMNLPEPPNQ